LQSFKIFIKNLHFSGIIFSMKKILSLLIYITLLGANEQFEKACGNQEACPILAELYSSEEIPLRNAFWLEKTLRNTKKTSHLDETLRRQLKALEESVSKHEIVSFYNVLDDFNPLISQARKTYFELESKLSKASVEEELRAVEELAKRPHLIAQRAQQLEERLNLKPWPKDKVRCGATARAVIQTLAKDTDIEFDHLPQGVAALMREIDKHHSEEGSWAYWGDSTRFDHVFVIVKLRDGRYRLLQSFVNRYSLLANISEEKPMSYDELKRALHKIHLIDEERIWNEKVAKNFEDVFKTPLPLHLQEEYNTEAPDFQFQAIRI
jgi:arsenate reductase-like glutaredoxin family protein